MNRRKFILALPAIPIAAKAAAVKQDCIPSSIKVYDGSSSALDEVAIEFFEYIFNECSESFTHEYFIDGKWNIIKNT